MEVDLYSLALNVPSIYAEIDRNLIPGYLCIRERCAKSKETSK